MIKLAESSKLLGEHPWHHTTPWAAFWSSSSAITEVPTQTLWQTVNMAKAVLAQQHCIRYFHEQRFI